MEVIKVVDFTDTAIHMKELMFVKIHGCSEHDMRKLSYIKEIFQAKMIDYAPSTALIESVQTETGNNDLIKLLESDFSGRIEVVRGGSVAIEAIPCSSQQAVRLNGIHLPLTV